MRSFLKCALLVAASLAASKTDAQIVRTVAGNDSTGTATGDGGPATHAVLGTPVGVAVDRAGNIFISDVNDHIIRKVTPAGIISVYAGTSGVASYTGDGGAATSATLFYPQGITVDAKGNLYIADNGNQVVRKVDTFGIITKVAGTHAYTTSGDGGPATSAGISGGTGVAVDKWGNLYIADGNTRVRKVDTFGIISTVAGTSAIGYGGDGGAATSAVLSGPAALAIDDTGNLYIADAGNQVVRKVNTAGTITTIAGNHSGGFAGDSGVATSARLNSPYAVAIDSMGNIFIADQNNNRIRKVNTAGIITTYMGNGMAIFSGDGGAPALATVRAPTALFFNRAGNLFIADKGNRVIREITDSASAIAITAAPGATVCAGTPITFTAAAVNGGYGAIYKWMVNGADAGTNAPTFTSGTLATGDTVTCTISEPFDTTLLATSAAVSVTINPVLATSVSITASPGTAIHYSTPVTFTATAVNGGTAPAYQWLLNGTPVTGVTGATFTSGVLNEGDRVACNVTSNATCAAPLNDVSNTDTIHILEAVPQLEAAGGFTLYPNPNKGSFTLAGAVAAAYTGAMAVHITDMAGREVYTGSVSAKSGKVNTVVSVQGLPAGIYLLRAGYSGQTGILYFTVEK